MPYPQFLTAVACLGLYTASRVAEQVRQIEEYTFAAFEAFTTATLLYSLVTGLVILIMRVVERRTRIAGTIAVGAK